MGKLFGTDGIRGIANHDLTARLAYNTGLALANVLRTDNGGVSAVIGKDTRLSSDMLENALTAGLCAGGADVMLLGVAPTPAVAYITTQLGADAGVVISASHNPYEYNGIKVFNGAGHKLSDEYEAEIENMVLSAEPGQQLTVAAVDAIGRAHIGGVFQLAEYVQHLRACSKINRRLRIAVDCANGAASATAERLFAPYASDLLIINNRPDGRNINDRCGSTAPEMLCRAVTDGGYDVGFAFDGDADRCIASDERGNIVDGDRIMAICGVALREAGRLPNNTVVATVMSNLGFRRYAREHGLRLLTAPVGDRNVLELMKSDGATLGGEQSGHIIFLDDATTGDGQLAAMKLLGVLTHTDAPLSALVGEIPFYPQVLINVVVADKDEAMSAPPLTAAIAAATAELGSDGRVLVRPSGTENLIRVMIEAAEQATAERLAQHIAATVG